MKYRTFTVLFVEEYDEGNGVEMTDPEAIAEVKDTLQDCYDNYRAPGTNFLIVGVEGGADEFWALWREKVKEAEHEEVRNQGRSHLSGEGFGSPGTCAGHV